MKHKFDYDFWRPLSESNRTIVSQGSNFFINEIQKIIPIEVHTYPSGGIHSSWTIPDQWNLSYGKIVGENFQLSSKNHGLLVQTYSKPVDGIFTKHELLPHIIFDKTRPDDFVYYSKLAYQYPKNISWKLSIPFRIWNNLPDGNYHVKIESSFTKGSMKTGMATLPGRSKKTVIFVAHYCHPYQFDDGLGGVAVAVELYNYLKSKNRNLTYKFLFVPETIGSVVELLSMSNEEISNLIGGFFVEAPGKDLPLSLKEPHNSNNEFSCVVSDYFHEIVDRKNFRSFRSNVSNDEIVFGDPDFNVPVFSLQRWPYDEYHTERDNLSNFNIHKFFEICDHLKEVVLRLDKNFKVVRKFKGPLYMYGNDLHVNYADNKAKFFDNWAIMNASGEGKTINEIARATSLSFPIVSEYYQKYYDKGLINLDITETYERSD